MDRRQDGTPIAEAARLLGLSQEAVRKRLQRATLPGYKQDEHWYVLLDGLHPAAGYRQDTDPAGWQDDRPDDGRTPAGRQDTAPIEASYRVTPAEIEQAVARTSAQYMGDLRAVLAEVGKVYEGRIAATEAASAAKDETIAAQRDALAELRRRAAAAERERDELRARLSTIVEPAPTPPAALGGAAGAHRGEDTPRRPTGLWERLRRALGRE
ncbi:MAG: sigma-70 region 4 domain-containing protein [Chloroflexota bacterium]|nr:sigma-70 region 4 domain-containing protein [Chloroflexota bacterium]